LDPTKSADEIKVLLGDETLLFQGNVIGTPPPVSQNGNINNQMSSDGTITSGAANILLSFPLHLRLSYLGDTLYFSEGYPTTSDGQYLFGSLSIRRYRITTGEVDTYCGVDFSNNPFNESHYNLIGSVGGYLDTEITSALFKYPMSIAVVPTDTELDSKDDKNKNPNNEIVAFHVIYVADQSNGAIRKIYPTMDTASPTILPTTFYPPSLQPTSSPTLFVASTPSTSFYDDLTSYQQILLVTGSILLGFLICFCCLSCCCCVRSDSSDTFEQGDLENSKGSFFHTPKKQKNLQDYLTQGWNQVNRPFQNGSPQSLSDDGQNGLLDVSMNSSTSSHENEEWEEMVWNRTPNLNISKQYRVSESKWPPKFDSLMHSRSDSSHGSHGTHLNPPVWSTITPFATQKVSFDEMKEEESVQSTPRPHSPTLSEDGKRIKSGHETVTLNSNPSHPPSSLFTRLTQWWNPSSADHEIQLNDSPYMISTEGQPISGDDNRKTPKTMLRKWNSSKWDQVDETVVSLQFED
jgi:hypothetical protein